MSEMAFQDDFKFFFKSQNTLILVNRVSLGVSVFEFS
jgi:hypothetical protein